MANPEITVMMPTHNAMPYVDTAVSSILAQNVDLCLLAYDDMSDDGTYERLLQWAERDKRVKAERPFPESGHFGDICNLLIYESRTKYVARMDADGISLPGRLEAQQQCLDLYPRVTILGAKALTISEAAKEAMPDPTNLGQSTVPLGVAPRRLVQATLFARPDQLLNIGGYNDLDLVSDWENRMMLAGYGGHVSIMPDVFYLSREAEAAFGSRQ